MSVFTTIETVCLLSLAGVLDVQSLAINSSAVKLIPRTLCICENLHLDKGIITHGAHMVDLTEFGEHVRQIFIL